uniref:Uncharacterized protein n=1 Tax=Rhizophora mucronata TaxID=61149 RepID=A0A2P2PQ02_RHIMU
MIFFILRTGICICRRKLRAKYQNSSGPRNLKKQPFQRSC